MKHLGDITKLNGAELEPVYVVTGGSPCQDLSVAGKRAGLTGERSGLYMEQIRIIKEMREADAERAVELRRPRFMVWENVPGAFSSNGGADFKAVLEEAIRIADPEAPDLPMPDKNKWTTAGCCYDGLGKWSIAWRVHDAQFWGVPQRRRRISLVADFGGMSAPEILFERKGVSGDFETSRAAREGIAENAEGSVGADDSAGSVLAFHLSQDPVNGAKARGIGWEPERCPTLASQAGGNSVPSVCVKCYDARGNGDGEMVCTMTGDHNGYVSDFTALLCEEHPVICIQGNCIDRADTAGCNGRGWTEDVSYTLNTIDRHAVFVDQQVIGDCKQIGERECFQNTGIGWWNQSDVAATLRTPCGGDSTKANLVIDRAADDSMGEDEKPWATILDMTHANDVIRECGETVPTLQSRMGTGGNQVPLVYEFTYPDVARSLLSRNDGSPCIDRGPDFVCQASTYQQIVGTIGYSDHNGVNNQYVSEDKCIVERGCVVRRLTPLECERLQGFPDGYTDIGTWTDSAGKIHECSDSARYKALGNSIAVPFWKWLSKRISAQYERDATLGSLFDGIGGFPYAWEHCNGKGSARWASEIEEFPIAVTKLRFQDDA